MRNMETKSIKQFHIGGCQTLERTVTVEFVERIVGTLHAAIEEVAGIGRLAEIGKSGIAAVERKIGSLGGVAARDQLVSRAGEAKQVEDIGFASVRRTIGDAAQRVR